MVAEYKAVHVSRYHLARRPIWGQVRSRPDDKWTGRGRRRRRRPTVGGVTPSVRNTSGRRTTRRPGGAGRRVGRGGQWPGGVPRRPAAAQYSRQPPPARHVRAYRAPAVRCEMG